MTVCNRCGKENQDHYKFCLGCGAELTAAPKPGTDMAMMKTMMADTGGPPGALGGLPAAPGGPPGLLRAPSAAGAPPLPRRRAHAMPRVPPPGPPRGPGVAM